MLSLNINHPDVEEFITKKQDLTKVTGANISVKVTDDFMKAVEAGEDYLLRYPVTYDTSGLGLEDYKIGELVEINDPEYKRVYVKKVNAKALWDILMHCAWNTAEPGIMFEGRMHNYSPDGVYPEFKMISTNPCLTGDTIVAVADERKGVTIKELAELGESFTVPCATKDESGVVIIKNRNAIAFKTGHKEVIKVVLSDGSSFRCTPDHRLALPDLEYIEAKDSLGLELSGANENLKVTGIEYLEEKEDVYDLTVNDYHNFFIVAKDENNLKSSLVLVHNCGEIPMGAYDSCRLIHLNLKSFIDNPFTENAKVNEELLYSVAYETMRLGDDLVELEIEAVNRIIEATKDEENKLEYELWSKINNTATKGRRAGAGFTSLADAIAMLGLKYDSPEGLKMIDYIMKIVFTAQLDSEIDMAIERGTFPSYNANLEWKNGKSEPGNDWYTFISEKFPEKARRMREYGRRNISFSTVRKVAA